MGLGVIWESADALARVSFPLVGAGVVFFTGGAKGRHAILGCGNSDRVRDSVFVCGAGDSYLRCDLCRRFGVPLFLLGAHPLNRAVFFSTGGILLSVGLSHLSDTHRRVARGCKTPSRTLLPKAYAPIPLDRRLWTDPDFVDRIINQAPSRIE